MKDFLHNLFVGKTGNPWVQFFRYFFSGGSAFAVYFVLLYAFTEYGHVFHLTSLIIAYLVSIFVNFLISKYVVFSSHRQKSSKQLANFFLVAMVGLCLQYGLVYFFTGLNLQYLIANVVASAMVYVVSFSLNRSFTFREKP